MNFPDLLIAALAQQHACSVYSLDKDFRHIPNLSPVCTKPGLTVVWCPLVVFAAMRSFPATVSALPLPQGQGALRPNKIKMDSR